MENNEIILVELKLKSLKCSGSIFTQEKELIINREMVSFDIKDLPFDIRNAYRKDAAKTLLRKLIKRTYKDDAILNGWDW